MIKCKHTKLSPVSMAIGRPMHLLQHYIITQIGLFDAAIEKELKFLPARISRSTAVSANSKCTTGIRIFKCGAPDLTIEPTFKQAGHKTISRTQHIEHVNSETRTGFTLIERTRNLACESDCSGSTTLANQGRARHLSYCSQCVQRIGAASCNMKFFFGANN